MGISQDDLPLASAVGEDIPDRTFAHGRPAPTDRFNAVAAIVGGTEAVINITSRDREDLVRHATIIARKTARIVGIVSPSRAVVLTDRGPMQVAPGDIIATNHPDDDPGSDVWPISLERFAATYESVDAPSSSGQQAIVESTNPGILIRVAIDKLRGPDGRGTDRSHSVAITKLEEALLWLNAVDVL